MKKKILAVLLAAVVCASAVTAMNFTKGNVVAETGITTNGTGPGTPDPPPGA